MVPIAEIEEARCTCGAGHGSGEPHMDWCDLEDVSDCCPTCRGLGIANELSPLPNSCTPIFGSTTCPVCDGTGRI